jgi:hypothetical protein
MLRFVYDAWILNPEHSNTVTLQFLYVYTVGMPYGHMGMSLPIDHGKSCSITILSPSLSFWRTIITLLFAVFND